MFEYIARFAIYPLSICRQWPFLPGALLLTFFCPPVLSAGIGDMFRPYMDYTVSADDNMLRVRDKIDPQTLLGTNKLSDISQRISGGLIFEKQISRQLLSADVNWSYTKFERFSQMNNDAKDLNGNWNWFVGNNFQGNMGANYTQRLAPFLFQPGVKNVRIEQSQYFNAAWQFHPSWRLHGDYTHYDLNSDRDGIRLRFLNRTENRFEYGLDYVTSSKNTIGIQLRNIKGDFSTPVIVDGAVIGDNGYDQFEVMSKINWAVTQKSKFQILGGWVERKNNTFSSRDFSGFNANLLYKWQPTDKIGVALNAWRETNARQNLTANFSVNTGVSLAPTWALTEKVQVAGEFSYDHRKFDRFSGFIDEFPTGRNNTFRSASVQLAYTPYPGLQVSATAYHNDLISDSSRGGFNANGANINLRYIYGNR